MRHAKRLRGRPRRAVAGERGRQHLRFSRRRGLSERPGKSAGRRGRIAQRTGGSPRSGERMPWAHVQKLRVIDGELGFTKAQGQ